MYIGSAPAIIPRNVVSVCLLLNGRAQILEELLLVPCAKACKGVGSREFTQKHVQFLILKGKSRVTSPSLDLLLLSFLVWVTTCYAASTHRDWT